MTMISTGGGRYSGPKEVKYLFIDGGYLHKAIEGISKKYFDGRKLDISFELLSRGFTKAFYYDCPAPQEKDESEEDYKERVSQQKEFFNKIRNTKGYHVFEGVVTGELGRPRQKQIDVKIAVDMLTHTIRGNMHQATLIAGDQDFKPLIDALIQEGMYVILWCERGHTSDKLIYSADDRKFLNIETIHRTLPFEIQEKYPLPGAYHGNKDAELKDYELIQKGHNENREWIELYQGESDFLFVYEAAQSKNPIFMKYGDKAFLLNYVEDIRFRCLWEDAEPDEESNS